jgi:hypothetical protein
MLFDLRGRRRRAVQATYLMLAILMGGGLVLFGIGGDVQGGLFDAFSDDSNDSGNETVDKRVESNEKKIRANPQNEAVLKALTRDYFTQATAATQTGQLGFPRAARDELRRAANTWQKYLALEPKNPDPSLATVALRVYDVGALNQPKQAQKAAAIVAEAQNTAPAYLTLVQYASLAGDKRTADLAGQKAIELAPKNQKKEYRAQVKAAKNPQAQTAPQG